MSDEAIDPAVRIDLIGGFLMRIGDDEGIADRLGTRPAELVQLLALTEGRQLVREQVIEALWPQLDADAGGANLRKAAHFARRACGDEKAVVLSRGTVALFPGRAVAIDCRDLEDEAATPLASGDAEACRSLAAAYSGELLPEARYRAWSEPHRERLRELQLRLLRTGEDWQALLELDPADEAACVELMREELERGARAAAIRAFGRLRTALREELGIVPGAESQALYARCIAGLGAAAPEVFGRELELARITALIRDEAPPQLLALRGSAGIGKSALCRDLARLAAGEGWFVASVTANEGGRVIRTPGAGS